MTPAVPVAYRGVWQRTLLETPTQRDDSTFVRWLQTPRWHADLRVPASLPRDPALLQGFAGCTEVKTSGHGEVCHWHRELDLQPPGPNPDAGWMLFETSERVIETGVHGIYREVWERLPGSTGAGVALGRSDHGGVFRERLLLAGVYLMQVRARSAAPHDLEISFGRLEQGRWTIDRSSTAALEGCTLAVDIERSTATHAEVQLDGTTGAWTIVDWDGAGSSIG